jgi:oligosaccharide repeat unit polymerase
VQLNKFDVIFTAICINFTICLFTILVRQWVVDENISTVLVVQSIGILSLLIIHTIVWNKIGGNDLSLAYIFFLMIFIFNLGKAVLFVFYQQEAASFFNFFTAHDEQIIVRAFEFGYVGFFVISCAMLLSFTEKRITVIEPSPIQISAALHTGVIFLALSLPAALIDLQAMVMQVLSGGYFALFNGEQSYGAAGIVKVLAFFLYPSLFLLLVSCRNNKMVVFSIFAFALAISLIKMLLGMRLVSLIPFIILLSLWDCTVRKINRKIIYLSGAFLFVIVFPALSLLRTGQDLTHNIDNTSALYRIVAEMSDSISPLIWVMQRAPSEIDFQYGYSFLLSLSTIIPNLFWDVHPAKTGSLALWLVNEVNPWIAERGGGYGFSIFAELYLNFYWFGMIVLFIFSILINKMAMIKKNPINTAFAFACFIGFMLWPRGELVTVARFIFWHVGFLWICYHLLVMVYRRQS